MRTAIGAQVVLAAVLPMLTWQVSWAQDEFAVPSGLKDLKIPSDNPLTKAKVDLGRQLYFEPRLSRDNTVSCASCHDPQRGWSNGEAFATGVRGQKGGRSAPTIINAAYHPLQFWDGRAKGLEGQALGPIQNPIEMDLSLDEMIDRLRGIPGYLKQFQSIFPDGLTTTNVARALASFERTILSGNAPYDQFKAGDTTALSEEAQAGRKIFFGKANCSACHAGPNFSDAGFHNLGVGINAEKPDIGRVAVSKLLGDRGAFKTPTLREIAKTAPYMHDGRFASLAEVIEFYVKGATPNPQLDEEIFSLKLTAAEKKALQTFLVEGLSSADYPTVKPPELPK
ncbi:MAG TPA: c-type cytochrome [Planctomycetes bacterium]|nr:c-type cytochrome [Planctomycetaceae bacterium]HIM28125.1 c-type cytochrome [Planctomycetota bacterium]